MDGGASVSTRPGTEGDRALVRKANAAVKPGKRAIGLDAEILSKTPHIAKVGSASSVLGDAGQVTGTRGEISGGCTPEKGASGVGINTRGGHSHRLWCASHCRIRHCQHCVLLLAGRDI